MLDLVVQIELGLPANKNNFAGLSFLTPGKLLSHVNRAPFEQLPFQQMLQDSEDVDEMEEQYGKIILHPWSEEKMFEQEVPANAVQFWAAIHSYQNGTGSYPYRLLATYALACLSTPVSNALVERMFSHVNAIETDKRNRMGLKMIEAATRIRTTLIKKDKCCKDFVVTKDMLQKFTSNMYQNPEVGIF